LNVDGIATINFAYFYAFRHSVSDLINPLNWLKGMAVLIGRAPEPNSIGLMMRVNLYNKKGKLIMNTIYYVMKGKGKRFKVPGYRFHLYPEIKNRIIEARELMREDVYKFQTQDKID
jgi:hypothetical protein